MGRATLSRTLWGARVVAFPLIGGLLIFHYHGAPAHYAPVNIGAFILGLLAIAFLRPPRAEPVALGAGAVLVAILALPLLTGPSLDGVTRWLPLGPLQLHSGMLVVPLLAALATKLGQRGWILLAAAMVPAALQPDAASVLALSLASFAMAFIQRDWRPAVTGLAGLALAVWAWTRGGLPPVPFVEGILPMLWENAEHRVQAAGLALLLLAPILYMLRLRGEELQAALPVAAAYAGFLAISCVGPYPVPLAGYGAASILGMMLALAIIAPAERDGRPEDRFS